LGTSRLTQDFIRGQRIGIIPTSDSDMNKAVTPEYLSLTELAIYASVAKNTLKKWLRDGMPHYQVNRCIRVRVDEFNSWMNRFRVGTSPDLDAMLDQVIKEVRQ